MGEGLGEEPRRKTAKLIGQEVESVGVREMGAEIIVEGEAFHPVHHQHRIFGTAVACVYKEFSLQKTDVCKIGRSDLLELVGDGTVGLGTPGLVFEKAFEGMERAVAGVLHFENHGEVAAAHDRAAIGLSVQPKIGQLVEVVLGKSQSIDILFYSRIEHSLCAINSVVLILTVFLHVESLPIVKISVIFKQAPVVVIPEVF